MGKGPKLQMNETNKISDVGLRVGAITLGGSSREGRGNDVLGVTRKVSARVRPPGFTPWLCHLSAM